MNGSGRFSGGGQLRILVLPVQAGTAGQIEQAFGVAVAEHAGAVMALEPAPAKAKAGGRCMDNIFVERLWRSLKYEEVYPHAY